MGLGIGTMLASIGIPLAVDLIGKPLLKAITGKGAPRLGLPKSKGGSAPRLGAYQPPPPFIGNWPGQTMGYGTKKKNKKREKDYC
jgi:hypothetical protein